MTDEELIKRLRKYKDDLLSITADRIEALVKEQDDAVIKRAAWELEAKTQQARAERLEVAGRAYREVTHHLKPCPETSAAFDAALGNKP